MSTRLWQEILLNINSNLNILDAVKYYLILFPILVILQLILERQRFGKSYKFSIYRLVVVQIFVFVCIGILSTTGVPNIWYIMTHEPNFYGDKIYLRPFRMVSYEQVGYALNVLLFIPFGFIVSLIRGSRGRSACLKAVVFGLVFSVMIETSQLFNFRTTDVDDVLTNVLGTFLGYLIFELGYSFFRRKLKNNLGGEKSILPRELIIYWFVIIVFWFVKL